MRKWIILGKREWIAPRYTVRSGTFPDREITEDEYAEAFVTQAKTPVLLVADHRRCLWWFRDRFYHHPNTERNAEVIKGLIIDKVRREERRRQRALDVARQDDDG